ncbi:MAG TPA: hypothetical protein DCY10_04040 [Clostridiales bacterium]|jgi:hypothetical protein|nr:hypothetical protein [Clostridiales bacterium]
MATKGNNYWIVTAFSFAEHGSYALAKKESERLAEKCPDKTFKIIRCKRTVEKDASSAEYTREMGARHAATMEEVREVLGSLMARVGVDRLWEQQRQGFGGGSVPEMYDAGLVPDEFLRARALLAKLEGE